LPVNLPDRSADVVISNHALEHAVRQPIALRRLLRPGGCLVLMLPINGCARSGDPTERHQHHLYTWTPLLFGNLLKEAATPT
jgi:ubiquinone/menaquinone biosynthesis C-methylase UbiE